LVLRRGREVRILGLDLGSRRIGAAISDPDGVMAMPLMVIEGTGSGYDSVVERIRGLLREYEVQRVVVGMPRSLDGVLGKQAEEVQRFVDHLSQEVEVPIDTWDERLSTAAARRMAIEARGSRGRRKKEVDDLAAVVILQGYLDRTQAQ
jgi:putative Holliday junction resolvase